MIAKNVNLLVMFARLYVSLSACFGAADIGWSSVKYDIGDINICQDAPNLVKIEQGLAGTLHED